MGGRGSSSGLSRPAKVGEEIYIADWFRDKLDLPYYAIKPSQGTIIKETEKAYQLDIETETLDGEKDLYFKKWIPKSAAKTEAQIKKEQRDSDRRYERGKQKYEKMLKFAKENNVKGVRSGMRKETILKKINESGLKYKY